MRDSTNVSEKHVDCTRKGTENDSLQVWDGEAMLTKKLQLLSSTTIMFHVLSLLWKQVLQHVDNCGGQH